MGKIGKPLALLLLALFLLSLLILPSATVKAQASFLSPRSYLILASSSAVYDGVPAGAPFKIGVFDMSDGQAVLSVSSGMVSPTSIVIAKGFWVGDIIITGTNSAVITVTDSQGHKSSSLYPIPILAPSPSPTPCLSPLPSPTLTSSQTPTVPELPWLVIAPLLLSVLSVAVMLRYRKTVASRNIDDA